MVADGTLRRIANAEKNKEFLDDLAVRANAYMEGSLTDSEAKSVEDDFKKYFGVELNRF